MYEQDSPFPNYRRAVELANAMAEYGTVQGTWTPEAWENDDTPSKRVYLERQATFETEDYDQVKASFEAVRSIARGRAVMSFTVSLEARNELLDVELPDMLREKLEQSVVSASNGEIIIETSSSFGLDDDDEDEDDYEEEEKTYQHVVTIDYRMNERGNLLHGTYSDEYQVNEETVLFEIDDMLGLARSIGKKGELQKAIMNDIPAERPDADVTKELFTQGRELHYDLEFIDMLSSQQGNPNARRELLRQHRQSMMAIMSFILMKRDATIPVLELLK